MKKRILIINGPNLNLLGIREPELYGTRTYSELVKYITDNCPQNAELTFEQTNHEGAIIDLIQSAYGRYDGIVLNAGAYTHTSIAIADAVSAVGIPCIEVHLTDTDRREPYRRVSFLKPVCTDTIKGMGFDGYVQAVNKLL